MQYFLPNILLVQLQSYLNHSLNHLQCPYLGILLAPYHCFVTPEGQCLLGPQSSPYFFDVKFHSLHLMNQTRTY